MTTISYGATPLSAPSHLRLTQRGRRVITALISAPLVVIALVAVLNGGMATATDSSAPVQYVSVESGQSLWQLAEQVAPAADPRDVIDAFVRFNELTSADIYPGQQLAVPTQYSS
jgi:LysM repeat protein